MHVLREGNIFNKKKVTKFFTWQNGNQLSHDKKLIPRLNTLHKHHDDIDGDGGCDFDGWLIVSPLSSLHLFFFVFVSFWLLCFEHVTIVTIEISIYAKSLGSFKRNLEVSNGGFILDFFPKYRVALAFYLYLLGSVDRDYG